jgi:hypothetical protein
MDRSLLNAVLSLDAYNRSYEPATKNLSSAPGTLIRSVSIISEDSSEAAQNAGFYAIAYQFGSEKIISYRGTDRNLSLSWSGAPGSNFINGYSLALGSPYGLQPGFAVEFYKAVAGGTDPFTTNIFTTGHSLGGALAANDNLFERLAA